MATVATVIDNVRRKVNDKFEVYRFSDATMIAYLNTAAIDLTERRPDLLLAAAGTSLSSLTTYTATGNTIQFQDSMLDPLADFIAAKCYGEDSADTFNAQMEQKHFGLYLEAIS